MLLHRGFCHKPFLRALEHSNWHSALTSNLTQRWQSSIARQPGPAVAIVGSGPAGFYTAQKIARELGDTKIDMYEQLPVPFGLVRFGVAPDHPEVKNCQDTFQDVAASPNFTFIGNVYLGYELPLSILSKHYDAIIFAYGASKDRKLGLDGEDNPHIYSARAFVGWYNGLPEYRDLNPDLTAGDTAIIIGQGNVALDVARTLLTNVDALNKTDITDYAIETLSKSRIKNVHVVGRRGPLQAAFTIKEVRELLQLPDVKFKPIPGELFPPDLKTLPRPKRRILELLQKGSQNKSTSTKSWSLDFLLSPTALSWTQGDPTRLEKVNFSRNVLEDALSTESKVYATPEEKSIPTSTLFRSIGYKAEAIPGMEELGAIFDDRKGTIQHDGWGRASSGKSSNSDSAKLYCAGWVKRGPTGVIASTMTDAFETAEAVVEDWNTRPGSVAGARSGWEGVQRDAEGQGLELQPVHWDNWKSIDQAERRQGAQKGKPREKFGRVQEMLNASRITT